MLGGLQLAGCHVRGTFQRLPTTRVRDPLRPKTRCSQATQARQVPLLQGHFTPRRQPLLTRTATPGLISCNCRCINWGSAAIANTIQVQLLPLLLPLRQSRRPQTRQLRSGQAFAPRLVCSSSTVTDPPPPPLPLAKANANAHAPPPPT